MVPQLSKAWDEVGFPRAAPSRVIRAINSPSLGMNAFNAGTENCSSRRAGGLEFPLSHAVPCSLFCTGIPCGK